MSAAREPLMLAVAREPMHSDPLAATGTPYLARVWELLRPRVAHMAVIAILATVIDFLRVLPWLAGSSYVYTIVLLQIGRASTLLATCVVIGVTLAQATPLRGWLQTCLMVAGACALVALGVAISGIFWEHYLVQQKVVSSIQSNLMYLGWEFTAMGVALALFYAAQASEAQVAARARESELERLELQRAMMESGLAVMRARVEPEFLFGALDEVRALYRRDRDGADEMIDAMIIYLRAALPQMRGEASTIGREIDLARAYVAVLQVPRRNSLAIEVRMEDAVRDIALPPMVLLPIAQAAFGGGDADARRRFAIVAGSSADGVTIAVEIEGGTRPDAWRGEGPETASRTLKVYFGTEARLEFATGSARHRAQIILKRTAVSPAHVSTR